MVKALCYSDDISLAAELAAFGSSELESMDVLAFGADADQLDDCGATRVLRASAEDIPEACAKSIAALMRNKGMTLLLVGATARGRDLAAQVAGYLDCGMGSDVSSLKLEDGGASYERNTYGGNVVSMEHISGYVVVTLGRGALERRAGKCAVEDVALQADARVRQVSCEVSAAEGVDIAAATCVVGVGMGLSTVDDVKLADGIANALGGAVGCSRGIAEERGWVPVERYIGISGRVLSPSLYLTLGISGQVQHLYGVRDAKIIAAIDKDEHAPITRNADYFIVGDLHEYAPLIEKAIREL